MLQVRGYRVAGPFTCYALHLSLSGCITGAGALLQNSPQLLLLGAVLPHKLRVRPYTLICALTITCCTPFSLRKSLLSEAHFMTPCVL